MIRTRFAPSPTGNLHIGGLRTALYAYALAKHENGKFILRIEDTDKKREVEGSRKKLEQILKDFGLNWDEHYVQSERLEHYKKAAEKLVSEGKAFYCECKAKNAKEEGFSKELRDPCRDKGLTSGAIKLMTPDRETVSFKDFVLNKKVEWKTSDVADATLLKSDGYPTYHLAVVVDDNDMNITHVLRGHDWMPSTPIHLIVYKFMGFMVPEIGHLTDIMDPDGGKLSKRKGSTSVEGLIADGYLPDAILNFIMLLGWAPKDNQELYTLEQFVKAFDANGFQKSNPVFNRDKLDWFNGQYIRQKTDEELKELLKPFLTENVNTKTLDQITPLIKERIKKLSDFGPFVGFFFEEPKVDTGLLGENSKDHVVSAIRAVENTSDWNIESLNDSLMGEVKENNFKTGDFFMDLRIAITGTRYTPPINESIIILGKEETLNRLKRI